MLVVCRTWLLQVDVGFQDSFKLHVRHRTAPCSWQACRWVRKGKRDSFCLQTDCFLLWHIFCQPLSPCTHFAFLETGVWESELSFLSASLWNYSLWELAVFPCMIWFSCVSVLAVSLPAGSCLISVWAFCILSWALPSSYRQWLKSLWKSVPFCNNSS